VGKEVDSGALLEVNRLLGIAGSRTGAQKTELEDGALVQVLDVDKIIRRSRTPAQSTGLFVCVLENVHAAADDEASQIDPYNPGADASDIGGYPAVVRQGFDVWLVGCAVQRDALAGDLLGGQVEIITGGEGRFLGWGRDDGGLPVASTQGIPVTQFGALNTGAAGGQAWGAEIGTGLLASRVKMRIRRGMLIRFLSTSSAAATFQLLMIIGLFPGGLEQDIVP